MDLYVENRAVTVPTLQTARLTLRALQRSDLDDVVRLINDYEVAKWLTMVPYPYCHADAEDFLHMVQAGELGTLWVIVRDDALLGVVSIDTEIGYWLGAAVWGQGYMSEACQAAIGHHFATTTKDAIAAGYLLGNDGSRRVLEKLGFVDTGTHIRFSRSRQEKAAGRSMLLSRSKWQQIADA